MPAPVPSPTDPALEPSPGVAGRPLWLATGLLALLGLLYGRSLGFGWLEVGDAVLRAPASLAGAWRAGGPAGLSLFLERAETALPSRLVALLLHAGSCLLVLALARRHGLGAAGALGLALLFALHPLRVEPVAWLSQRASLLSGFLLLLAAWLALGPTSARRRALAAALGLLGALCLWWQPPAEDPLGFGQRLAFLPHVVGELAARWVLPGLAPAAVRTLALGWAVLLGLGALSLTLRRRAPRLALGGLVFLGLACASALASPAPLGASTGYLAALGLELAFVAALAASAPRPGGRVLVGCALLLGAWTPSAWRQLDAWRSEEALQARALALDPGNARAHDTLGLVHLAHGRLSEAQRACERALALRPDDRLARLHLGELELRRALVPGFEAHFRRAEQEFLRCEPAGALRARVALGLGEVYQRTGDFARAHEALLRATAAAPDDARSRARLGMVALRLGALPEARAAFEQATRLAPEAVEGWCGRGVVAFQENDLAAARAPLERALALEPDHPESNATLGRVLELLGDDAGAERHYRRALAVSPDNVDALYALGARLASASAPAADDAASDEALRLLERALALSRERIHVRAALASARLWLARGERERARQHLNAVLAFNPSQAEARALLDSLDGAGR